MTNLLYLTGLQKIMLEREFFPKQILRKTPSGSLDIKKTLRNIREPHSENEVGRKRYLDSLSGSDRENVENFLKLLRESSSRLMELKLDYVVVAVGSSVKGKKYPQDLDLRVFFYAKNPQIREEARDILRGELESNLRKQKVNFKTNPDTRIRHFTKNPITGYERREIHKYSDDSSLSITYTEGSPPLHVSLAGQKTKDAKTYLKMDKRRNGTFSILFDSRRSREASEKPQTSNTTIL